MSKKDEFVKFIERAIDNLDEEMPDDIKMYWEAFKGDSTTEKPMFTDSGKMVLKFMQEHQSDTLMKSKDIAFQMGISSRKVSGAFRKLVSDGYVEKFGCDPVCYSLTESGKTVDII